MAQHLHKKLMKAVRLLLLPLALYAALPSQAAEPQLGVKQGFDNTAHAWRLDREEGWLTLHIFAPAQTQPYRTYDLSSCHLFCAGEEDNCDQDGIYSVAAPEPTLAVVCHKGAHSQRVMLFQPYSDAQAPILTVTGDYWVSVEKTASGLTIRYDQDEQTKQLDWLATAKDGQADEKAEKE